MTTYVNPSKDQFEWLMFETLKTKIDDFPCGKIDKDKQKSPDFIIKEPDRTVGIEVAGADNPNHAGPTPLKEIRGAQFKCFRIAKQILVEERDAPVKVEVKFRDDKSRINIEDAARELCDFVLKEVDIIDDTKIWRYYKTERKYIRWIFIHLGTSFGNKCLNEHRVVPISSHFVNTNPHDIIQKAIDRKNAKFAKYQKKCDECWLIIGVNELTAPEAITIEYNNDSTPYFSNFARTYFVRGVEGLVWLLNVVPSNTRNR
ncbi:hypothetical protein KA005_33385 [bacterium]|nr:hypothetical protein [bacterium]